MNTKVIYFKYYEPICCLRSLKVKLYTPVLKIIFSKAFCAGITELHIEVTVDGCLLIKRR